MERPAFLFDDFDNDFIDNPEVEPQENNEDKKVKPISIFLDKINDYGYFSAAPLKRKVLNLKSEKAEDVVLCKFPELTDGQEDISGYPPILVTRNEVVDFLNNPGKDEYCNFDKDTGVFSFYLCGAEGTFNSTINKFESLRTSKKEYSSEELEKIEPSCFYNMIPRGTLLGRENEKSVDVEFLTKLKERDLAIARIKDVDLNVSLNDSLSKTKSLIAEVLKNSRNLVAEQRKIVDLKRKIADKNDSFVNRTYIKLFKRLYPEKNRDKMGFSNKIFYNILKPASLNNEKLLEEHLGNFKKYQSLMDVAYNDFEDVKNKLMLDLNKLPIETLTKLDNTSRELNKWFGEFTYCSDQHHYFDDAKMNLIENYDRYMITINKHIIDCLDVYSKEISVDKNSSDKQQQGKHEKACDDIYVSKIESISRLEIIKDRYKKIGQTLEKAGIDIETGINSFADPVDKYCFLVGKKIYADREENNLESCYKIESKDIVCKMCKFGYSTDVVVDILKDYSPCFVGKDRSVIETFVKQSVDDVLSSEGGSHNQNVVLQQPDKSKSKKSILSSKSDSSVKRGSTNKIFKNNDWNR